MLTIDGSQGEGGGQILRSSVALSAITGTPLRIHNIRAGRKKPGLKRQHATAVNAAAQLCGAEIEGASPGSDELRFSPGTISGGDFTFTMGTAGSTMLVFQTLLPILLNAEQPSTVTLKAEHTIRSRHRSTFLNVHTCRSCVEWVATFRQRWCVRGSIRQVVVGLN